MPRRSAQDQQEIEALARRIIDQNVYMTLATADPAGRPWASPVYYAADGYDRFHWVSLPDAQHSRNLAARPELAIVIFDSRVPLGTGQAVYMEARAEQIGGNDLKQGIAIFSRESLADGGSAWGLDRVVPPAPLRLYRAAVSQHWVLDPDHRPGDARTEVRP
jgi:nitroimidazol reductase NimA-like FMN-containing flavoprotein (pyridoxamine 5'-phosphate oxidase superfamily)